MSKRLFDIFEFLPACDDCYVLRFTSNLGFCSAKEIDNLGLNQQEIINRITGIIEAWKTSPPEDMGKLKQMEFVLPLEFQIFHFSKELLMKLKENYGISVLIQFSAPYNMASEEHDEKTFYGFLERVKKMRITNN